MLLKVHQRLLAIVILPVFLAKWMVCTIRKPEPHQVETLALWENRHITYFKGKLSKQHFWCFSLWVCTE